MSETTSTEYFFGIRNVREGQSMEKNLKELNPEIQDLYLNNVILNSKRGYITWNYFSQYHYNGYSLADLVRIIPGSQIIPEKPLTSDTNAIIVWG